ncbi:hypothetical protein CQW23_17106 [Capsicum baccatum]|uniref:LYK3/RLK10-like LysM domain-containing protein n=1 Tax=Capsicum baccatum TaxID=33114 RepID=A0A2G2WCV6_CAPBA|nr:hypothetical protein CQW23_17106 [Capsicum baccatum]
MFSISSVQEIMDYSDRSNIPNQNSVIAGRRINIPFRCDCLNNEFLGHVFPYQVNTSDTYSLVASNYSDLTTVDMLRRFNRYPDNSIPNDVNISVVVNCSCGDSAVSEDYGLFVTYPLRQEDNLTYVASTSNVSEDVIRRYNPGLDAKFSAGRGIIYIPGREGLGSTTLGTSKLTLNLKIPMKMSRFLAARGLRLARDVQAMIS